MLAARIALASIAVLVVAALWYAFRPQPTAPVQSEVTGSGVQVAPQVLAAPARTEFDFVVRDGKRVSGPATLRVRQGEQVMLRIESNANDELHVHGYDLKLSVRAGEPATLEFGASRSGRFGLELHNRHAELGALEVYPQ